MAAAPSRFVSQADGYVHSALGRSRVTLEIRLRQADVIDDASCRVLDNGRVEALRSDVECCSMQVVPGDGFGGWFTSYAKKNPVPEKSTQQHRSPNQRMFVTPDVRCLGSECG